jgi:cytochrome c556
MRFKSWTIGVLLAATVLATSGIVAAADPSPADEIIKTRQDNFKAMGGAAKAIGDQLKTGAPDKAIVTENAKKIAMLSKEVPSWFPKGSGPESGVETQAKPEIWTQPADFAAAAAKLPVEADKLVQVAATGDAAAIGDQLKATGATCGGCHKAFRVPPKQ